MVTTIELGGCVEFVRQATVARNIESFEYTQT